MILPEIFHKSLLHLAKGFTMINSKLLEGSSIGLSKTLCGVSYRIECPGLGLAVLIRSCTDVLSQMKTDELKNTEDCHSPCCSLGFSIHRIIRKEKLSTG